VSPQLVLSQLSLPIEYTTDLLIILLMTQALFISVFNMQHNPLIKIEIKSVCTIKRIISKSVVYSIGKESWLKTNCGNT
jgi:hypothetical protein